MQCVRLFTSGLRHCPDKKAKFSIVDDHATLTTIKTMFTHVISDLMYCVGHASSIEG